MKISEKITRTLSMSESKLNIGRIWNSLDEFQMNELEPKVNEEIEILANRETRASKNINSIGKQKSELNPALTDIETMKTVNLLLSYGIKDIFTRHIKNLKYKTITIIIFEQYLYHKRYKIIKNFLKTFCLSYGKKVSSLTKIENQIEECIAEKNLIIDMIIINNLFKKELNLLNLSTNEIKVLSIETLNRTLIKTLIGLINSLIF